MIQIPDTKPRFFSVKYGVHIDGVRYMPTVCYKLTGGLYDTVKGLEAKGLAKTYTEEMRFVTGTAYPVKKPEAAQPKSRPITGERASVKVRGDRPVRAASQKKLERKDKE
jgi:hypothetical protein